MIGSLMSRMEDAQKLSIQQLQKSIQDGVLPAYIGIPLLQDKIKQAQSAQTPQAPQQPPIAQQVLQQAKQIESGIIPQQPMPPQQSPQMAQEQMPQMTQQMPQGIDNAESNLPTEMAEGGIVGYARGSIIDDEDDDIDPTEDFRTASKMFARDPMEQRREAASILGMGDSIRPMLSSFTQPISDFASGIKSKFINKTPEVNTVVKTEIQPEGGIPGIIASKAQKYNLPPQLMSSIAKAESNFNPNAGNKTGSSAKGLYQFIDKTWMGMGGKPGEQFDPEINSELGAKYIRQNAEFLKNRLGRDPSYSEVYAAHYFGPSGASNLLTRANPKDSIEKGLGTFNDPKGVKLIMKQNPNLRGKTVGQVLNDLETKTGSGIVSLAQGGQIKHFQVGNLVTDDYRSNYDRIFGNKNVTPSNPITMEEIRANQEKIKQLKAAQQAQGIRPPVSPPSNAPRANAASTSSLSGGITEIAKALQSGQSNVPKTLTAGSGENTYPGMSDLNYYNELLAKSKEDPTYTPYQDEMKKLLARNPDLLKNNTVTPDLRGPLANVAKPSPLLNVQPNVPVKTSVNANATIIPPTAATDTSSLGDDTNTEIGGLMAPFTPRAEEKELTTKVEEKSAFDKFLEGLEAKRGEIKGKKDEDKYMSLLAAGLGMMSGTSQFAAANIGKGALAGVQDYRDTQKQRAAELAAVDKEIGSGLYRKTVGDYYTANALSKDEKAKRDQAALLDKTQQNAMNTIANIEKDLMARALASIKDSLAYTTGSDEKRQSLLNASYSTLRQRMTPYITNLQKKAGLEMPDMDAMLKEPINFDDIQKPKK
jgi:hypothetical protein